MSTWQVARLIAAKDLRVERRSKIVTNQVLPFAGITMVSFAFALDKQNVLDTVAPGLIWLATTFSLLILVQRSFSIETDDGALDAMRVAGIDARAIFLGKAMALAVQLLVLEILLLFAAVVLYGESIQSSGAVLAVVLLVTTLISATCGLAAVGTLYGGLAAGFKGSETLLPLLTLPAVAPVLIGATKAVESAVGTAGAVVSEGWQWVGLLAVFAVAFGIGGALAFGPLIDE
jgi:heme exporter protein B